jgi:GntR family transcriptional repressor for pyruvate dehydrogenase complex
MTSPDERPAKTPVGRPSGGAEGTASMFSRVSDRRISELIVDQVRLLIRQQNLMPGDRLPSERELCERFGVSRVTVREALRVLEAGGLVAIKVGARGGAFVTTPSSLKVGEGIADLLTLSPVTAAEVTEARMIFELGIVPLVCERADETDVADLLEICAQQRAGLAEGPYDMDLSAQFHARLARSTHNAAVEMLVQSFRGPLLMSLERAQESAPEMGKRGVTEHVDFVKAVQARDVARATEIMRRHLGRTARRVQGR